MAEFTEEGIVLSTQDKKAVVKITPKGTCPDSHAGCPVRALAKTREFTTEADNLVNAKAGQKVIIKMESPHFYKGLLLVFVLPLALLFIGYSVGISIARLINSQEDLLGYIFMGIGFLSSFFLMGRFGKDCAPTYKIIEFAR